MSQLESGGISQPEEMTKLGYLQHFSITSSVAARTVVIAEPLAGLLSPSLAQEFSGDYCKRIVDAVKDEGFAVVYHNCGNTANVTLDSIFSCGANAYHFGNAIKMEEIMEKAPSNIICMGNVSPTW